MTTFVIFCIDKPGHTQVRMDNRPDHLEFLKGSKDMIVTAGPMQSDDGESMIGSMLVIDFAAADPYAKAGLFESTRVMRWKQVIPAAE